MFSAENCAYQLRCEGRERTGWSASQSRAESARTRLMDSRAESISGGNAAKFNKLHHGKAHFALLSILCGSSRRPPRSKTLLSSAWSKSQNAEAAKNPAECAEKAI